MAAVETELREAIAAATPRLLALSDAEAAKAPAPGKWSPKQVLGHLIDSASNNHQRFVRAQFTDDLVFAGYQQEPWVEASVTSPRRGRSSWSSGASTTFTSLA